MSQSHIKKAVIPVAGLGTRMLPATKAIPKEMLPIVDKPLIQYIVNECVAAGINEIVLVTHSSKNAIENHFDTSFELEATLEKRVKRQLLDQIKSIIPKDTTIMHVRQGEAKGLGHAILKAKPIIGDEPFVVVLPDVILDEFYYDSQKDNLVQMMHHFSENKASQIMVEAVDESLVDQYGIADCHGKQLSPGDFADITAVVEKPPLGEAPSNLAVVGRYVLSAKIWEYLEQTQAGAGGEIQLTDAIAALMAAEPVQAYCMVGKSHDCGSKLGYMNAFAEYGLRDTTRGKDFRKSLVDLLAQYPE